MYLYLSALSALLCGRLMGHALFVCVLFGAIGLLCARIVCGIQFPFARYAAFVVFLLHGVVAEVLAEMSRQGIRADGLLAAWVLFLPTLFFLAFTPGIRSRGRKYTAVAYASSLMLLHIYAALQIGIKAAYAFLPMQLAALFFAASSIKRKNDA